MNDIRVAGKRDIIPSGFLVIDVTSTSPFLGRELSPFLLGPVPLYWGMVSKNVENAWQYAKVYQQFVNRYGNPSRGYWEWARDGWKSKWATRYPMGKGTVPLYSFWAGEKLGYIEARRRIYIQLYWYQALGTDAFWWLVDSAIDNNICLVDFDGYDHVELGMSLEDVIECESRKMGHAFVLAMMLTEYLGGRNGGKNEYAG